MYLLWSLCRCSCTSRYIAWFLFCIYIPWTYNYVACNFRQSELFIILVENLARATLYSYTLVLIHTFRVHIVIRVFKWISSMPGRYNVRLSHLCCSYVERIKCIAVDFFELVTEFNVKHKQAIPQSAVQLIFLNIQPIYQLNENILTELQQRMDTW